MHFSRPYGKKGRFLFVTMAIVLFNLPLLTYAQQLPDTIVKSFHDTLLVQSDTLLAPWLKKITDSLFRKSDVKGPVKSIDQRKQQTEAFFNTLGSKQDSSFLWKSLYPLIFKRNKRSLEESTEGKEVTHIYQEFKGKTIRKIEIRKLGAFGTTVYDTIYELTKLDRILNSTHVNTLTPVIKNYLLIKPGDELDPLELADNERIIRDASIFSDARFIVRPVQNNDSVDLVLIVQDIYPVGIDFNASGIDRASLKLTNRNFFGTGHKIEQRLDYDGDTRPIFYLSEGAYKVRNIAGSFFDADLLWKSAPDGKAFAVAGNKPFITPEIKYAGGFSLGNYTRYIEYDSLSFHPQYQFNNIDLWSGYATIIERDRSSRQLRTQAAITGRYQRTNFIKTPEVVDRNVTEFVKLQRYLVGFSFLKSGFYRNNMIFGFGRTEDIPIGYLGELTLGYEKFDKEIRTFTGLNLLRGDNIKGTTYLYSRLNLGGYWHKGDFTDGFISADLFYISSLMKAGTNRIRHFFQLHYLAGINRQHYRYLELNNNPLTNTYNNYNYEGRQRISLRMEAVLFTSYYILGFRFAPYSFFEAAMISSNNRNLFRNPLYPAIGVGIRIKNENLVFSTFQFSFTIFPRPDTPGSNLLFEVANATQVNIKNFGLNPPVVPDFR